MFQFLTKNLDLHKKKLELKEEVGKDRNLDPPPSNNNTIHNFSLLYFSVFGLVIHWIAYIKDKLCFPKPVRVANIYPGK